tara:strand:+ start:1401 stop:1730 length:330 start_codon:yes stop_codon:yes gene_type:complete
MAKKQTKTKIKIAGKSYMIPVDVKKSIEFLSDVIRAHEVALLTWEHKVWNKQAFDEKDIAIFEQNMHEYVMRIPNAGEILANMVKIDEKEKNLEEETTEEKVDEVNQEA